MRHGPGFRWLVLLTVMVGMMASIMSSTIVNVAVPDMSRYFHIGQDRAQWISAAFMASTTLSLLLTPWLLQRFGLRKTYIGANLLLMVGGIVGGLSGNYPVMIAMRVLEGAAAGILTPIPNVVIMREFPGNEQGRAIVAFVYGIGLFGSTYLLPIYLQSALDYSPSKSGFVLLPAGLALAITMPVAGRLADKMRASRLVAGGLLLMMISTLLTATVSAATPILVLMAWVVLGRIGIGVIMPSLSLGSMRGLGPAEVPQAASMTNFLRQLGGAVGVSLVGILLEWRLAAHSVTLLGEGGDAARVSAFAETFVLLAAISAPAIVAGWFMEPKKR